MTEYRVVIKEFGADEGEYEKEYNWTTSERRVDRIDEGININLNHERFYTLIEEVES